MLACHTRPQTLCWSHSLAQDSANNHIMSSFECQTWPENGNRQDVARAREHLPWFAPIGTPKDPVLGGGERQAKP